MSQIHRSFRNNEEETRPILRSVDRRSCSFTRVYVYPGLKVARHVRAECQGSIFTDIDTSNLSLDPMCTNSTATSAFDGSTAVSLLLDQWSMNSSCCYLKLGADNWRSVGNFQFELRTQRLGNLTFRVLGISRSRVRNLLSTLLEILRQHFTASFKTQIYTERKYSYSHKLNIKFSG